MLKHQATSLPLRKLHCFCYGMLRRISQVGSAIEESTPAATCKSTDQAQNLHVNET